MSSNRGFISVAQIPANFKHPDKQSLQNLRARIFWRLQGFWIEAEIHFPQKSNAHLSTAFLLLRNWLDLQRLDASTDQRKTFKQIKHLARWSGKMNRTAWKSKRKFGWRTLTS